MAFQPSDPGILGDPATWVLIIHTLFANGGGTTIQLGPYSEAGCHKAAEHYEAGVGLTIHFGREGGDPDMVLRAVSICLPGPDRSAPRPR